MNYIENSNQIQQLWQEVEWQNESIAQIRQILNENRENEPGMQILTWLDNVIVFADILTPNS